jgi:hypothetical protein
LQALESCIDHIDDGRQPGKVKYPLLECYFSAFAMFFLQDPSLLEFQRRFQQQVQQNNLASIFGVEEIPSDTQLRDVLDEQESEPLKEVYRLWFNRLQRSKQLERYRVFAEQYLITLDGSQYFSSERVHCSRCLSRQKSGGQREYYHQILQPALVHPQRPEVIPLAPEFIRKQDGSEKQDSEVAAGLRALERIRADHRQLPAIIVADALYATEAVLSAVATHRFSFVLGVKSGSHKTLFEDVEGLRRGKLLDRYEEVKPDGSRYRYEWVNQVPLFASAGSSLVNFLQLQIFDATGKRTRCFSWITDLPLDIHTVAAVAHAARARWKIENENFNTLKNHGYHLEHNFGHGTSRLSETFFLLNTLAFFMHQIFALVDGLYQLARAGFGSRREYWNVIRASLRLILFESWDHVLHRIHGPPLPTPNDRQ